MKDLPALTALCLFAAAAQPLSASEPPRQLGAHEHGRGFLNIAIEGNRLSLEFQAPGSDVARSETKPDTPERKAAVQATIATLEKPLELFRLPADAGCTLNSSKARMTIIGEDDHKQHGDKGHGHAKHEQHSKQDKHAHGHKAGGDHRGHADYHGAYQFTCTTPARLTAIELPYFKVFPRAQKLSVQMIGQKGQTGIEATPAKPVVSLKGAT